jgi:tRNA(Ile)-lysidine synthase TilS/MesJ
LPDLTAALRRRLPPLQPSNYESHSTCVAAARIAHERMFSRDQRVLVAVSGGKESLALWHVLNRLGYQADGRYIRLGIADYSRRSQEKSEAFAAKHGLTLHQVDLKEDQGSTCGRLRIPRPGGGPESPLAQELPCCSA